MSYLSVFVQMFEKALVIFEKSTLECARVKKIPVKTKKVKYRPKYLLFGYI